LTWTRAFGKGSGWLLQKIVNGLALTRISPNMLTFIGLVINIIAACFFGFARPNNANRMFLYAGLIIIGAGVFDMVDGRVARKTSRWPLPSRSIPKRYGVTKLARSSPPSRII